MAFAPQITNGADQTRSGASDAVYFVVRQPILDLRGRVHAFKLLFREESPSSEAGVAGQNSLRSIASFGLERPSQLKKITGSLTAFVECTEEMLSVRISEVLPASLAILEISSSIEPSAAVIAACHELKTLGFRLALCGFKGEPGRESLIELADYIEVDFRCTDSDTRRNLCARMQGKRALMQANKVETQADYSQARKEGFSLFAGSYYCQPGASKDRRPPANQLLRIEVLKGLQQQPMDLHKMSQLVMRDGPLTFHLLRFANSPLCALRQEVQSIETALLTMGEDTFRRIAIMAIASQFNGDQPSEILCMGIIRARFCEVAGLSRKLDPFNQYLLGLLSLLPAMQGLPMCDLAPTLPLSIETREALMGTKNQTRSLLGWLESYERGEWDACKTAVLADELNQQELSKCYVEAVEWAEAALHSTT